MGARRDLSSVEHGCIGAFVGSLEQSIMQPAVFWKAELQQDRFKLSRAMNPMYCYRGLPVAVASIAPITCIQFATTNVCINALKKLRGSSSTSPARSCDTMIAGVVAGVASSLVQSPLQLVEVNQQRYGGSIVAIARRVIAADGVSGLGRGLSMAAIREGIFCWSYIAMVPTLKRSIRERRPETSQFACLAGASIISGTVAGVLSHPADTLKTRLQGSIFDESRPSGPREALRQLQQSGTGGLMSKCYKGLSPRIFRLVCCTWIYSTLKESMEDYACEVSWGPTSKPRRMSPEMLGDMNVVRFE